jgi:adenylate cyclase
LKLPDLGAVVEALSNRLCAAGVPLARATSHVQTLHPRYVAISRIWEQGKGVREVRPLYDPAGLQDYQQSPLRMVRESQCCLDVRLDRPHGYDLPMFEEFRRNGLTHYVMMPLRFSNGAVNGVSWATAAAGGFTRDHLELFHSISPTLTLVVEMKALYRTMPEILAAYVGNDPARRILAGSIHRGEVQKIDAAMVSFDLRGFTALSNSETPERVMEWLNGYFDVVVPSVEAAGGEVLKFTGDGVLAAFTVDGDPSAACHRALECARATLDGLAAVPSPVAPYRPVAALHRGTVAYGNIGAGDRLDFTAIGSDVNLVSRLETLCKDLDVPLLMSESFAIEVGQLCTRLGDYELRGFAGPFAVYGWCEAAC